MSNIAEEVDEEEYKTATTMPLTEYNLTDLSACRIIRDKDDYPLFTDKIAYYFEVDQMMKECIMEVMNHERDRVVSHVHEEYEGICFCYLDFFWKLWRRCCG